ncbi:MAG: SO_0444 family Cu/Zn efflux transporter [Thermodesulfobacteriota bacterium]
MWLFVATVLYGAWEMLIDSSVYILFGLLVGGMLRTFLSPTYVARHLGHGRFLPVFKAALFGIPIPLCSCGVLPAAASLKKQGANNGATAAFLISTPESGVDSIVISYALLDPFMTVARPLTAFISAMAAGIGENLFHPPRPEQKKRTESGQPARTTVPCFPSVPTDPPHPLPWPSRIKDGLRYAHKELWGDMAGWFFLGLLAAGLITALVPDELMGAYLGGGVTSMLLMLVAGIPLYICATASTPIAAAMILKGVSPGAALVFLLVGPATNITSLSVLLGILGKRATALYLLAISGISVMAGLLLDWFYLHFDVPIRAVIGQGSDMMPAAVQWTAAAILLFLSVRPLLQTGRRLIGTGKNNSNDCGCDGACVVSPFPAMPQHGKKAGTD